MTDDISRIMICARDVYRNCVRLLRAADPLMEERRFSRYSDWKTLYDKDPTDKEWRTDKVLSLQQADRLLPGYLFHQYYGPDLQDTDIVTVCAAPWRRAKPESYQPVSCVTRFRATTTDSDDVYWLGTIPIWEEKNQSDGQLHEFDATSLVMLQDYTALFERMVVQGTKITGISIPLDEATSSEVLAEKLLKTLLGPNSP